MEGKSGVAVIRLSGEHAKVALLRMIKPQVLPKPRFATFSKIYNPFTGEHIDSGLVLYFPKPNSFTGEDTVELQTHGSKAVTKSILDNLIRMEHIRLAEPGEFTKRSFYNGKMDLTQVEGLADLLDSETETQRKIALHQMNGGASEMIHDWENRIITLQVDLMADTDFGDTDEINFNIDQFYAKLLGVQNEMKNELDKLELARNIKDGIRVFIYGAPNVGKTSVFNMLSDSDSIVTNIPGTTRDMVESVTHVSGYKVRFVDSAGIRIETQDFIEGQGIFKAVEALEDQTTKINVLVCSSADLLRYISVGGDNTIIGFLKDYMNEMGLTHLHNDTRDFLNFFKSPTIVIMNKYDLINDIDGNVEKSLTESVICFSCKTNYGFTKFYTYLMRTLYAEFEPDDGVVSFSSMRHKEYLLKCISELSSIKKDSLDSAIAVTALDRVIKHLELLAGKTAREKHLDSIFEKFCVGK